MKKNVFLVFALLAFVQAVAQKNLDSLILTLEPISIESSFQQASNAAPLASTNIKAKDIQRLNNGQDLPFLLRFTPSLTVTSDAGNGVGYTGLWIRGSDPTRVNVNINGIALNDPESHQVFWVNTPDLASSVQQIQIQRGIGTSVNGAGSLGGSIHINTDKRMEKKFTTIQQSYGSFNTFKSTVESGVLLGQSQYIGRFSVIQSQGYVDRAETNLESYYFSGVHRLMKDEAQDVYIYESAAKVRNYQNSKYLKWFVFGGKEKTYQAWNGTPWEKLYGSASELQAFIDRNGWSGELAENLFQSGRTYNYYTYENEIDNYSQHHAQLNYTSERHVSDLKIAHQSTLHYTHGEGYFEQFKKDEYLLNYDIPSIYWPDTTIAIEPTGNVIRRRWLNNNFFGYTGNVAVSSKNIQWVSGLSVNHYNGQHYGRVVGVGLNEIQPIDVEYYKGNSDKTDGMAFTKLEWSPNLHWIFYSDFQLRGVHYWTAGEDNDGRIYLVDEDFVFFNPKGGFRYISQSPNGNKISFFGSLGKSSKEPNRSDFVDASYKKPVSEDLLDIEMGGKYAWGGLFQFELNAYFMNYKNQLVLTGVVNDVGAPVRTNVKESFRRGIEVSTLIRPMNRLEVNMNLTWSENRIVNFIEEIYNYDLGEVLYIERGNTPIAFSPNLTGSFQLSYAVIPRSWTNAYAKNNHQVYLLCNQKYVGDQHLDNTGNEDARIQAYFPTDFGLQLRRFIQRQEDNQAENSTIRKNRVKELTLGIWVNNALNLKYETNGYAYSYIYGEQITERFYYPQAGRNWMLNLTVNL
ncbi:MAG: TonB-dependent receptor [Bacteroidota bacterium]